MKIDSVWMKGAVLALFISSTSGTGWAGEVKNREENQQDRIAQGVKSGELTPGEAAHLEKGEQKIETDREKALSDGKMTPKEKAKLNREENRESKKIYKKKHNKKKFKNAPPAPATT